MEAVATHLGRAPTISVTSPACGLVSLAEVCRAGSDSFSSSHNRLTRVLSPVGAGEGTAGRGSTQMLRAGVQGVADARLGFSCPRPQLTGLSIPP